MLTDLAAFLKKHLLPAMVGVYAALAPLYPALGAITGLCLVELVLAAAAAKRAGRPFPLFSNLLHTLGKALLYVTASILAFVTQTWLTGPLLPVTQIVTGFIGARELVLCLKSLDELNGSPVFATILSKLAPTQPPSDGDPKQ